MSDKRKFQIRIPANAQDPERIHTEETARAIRLAAIRVEHEGRAEHDHLDTLPFHHTDVTGAPATADCVLQLWEIDLSSAFYGIVGRDAEHINRRENRFLANIPGVIVGTNKSWSFVATGDAQNAHVERTEHGFAKLELPFAGEKAPREFKIPLGEYEGCFELGAVLKERDTDRSFASIGTTKPHLVPNVAATVHHQIKHRGGITAYFVAKYDKKEKDKEFMRQAKALVKTLPALKVVGGKLRFGCYEITSYKEIPKHMEELRSLTQSQLGLAEAPTVGTVAIFAHGTRNGMMINQGGYDKTGSLRRRLVPSFVGSIKDHLADTVVLTLMGCSTARGGGDGDSKRLQDVAIANYGRSLPCEEVGADSLAWTINKQLMLHGIRFPTVWGHTITAHTTKNRRLRVFSSFGSADFTNILFDNARVKDSSIRQYIRETQDPSGFELDKEQKKDSALVARKAQEKTWTKAFRMDMVRTLHYMHAFYLPWEWNGGVSATADLPGFSRSTQKEVERILADFRGEIGFPGSLVRADHAEAEELEFEGARSRIKGKAAGAGDVQLSEHFKLSDFESIPGALPLRVSLVQGLQILRYRTGMDMEIAGIIPREGGGGAAGVQLRLLPNQESRRKKLLDAVNTMVSEDLPLAHAFEKDELVHVMGG